MKQIAPLVLAVLTLTTALASSAHAQERSAGYALHSPERVAFEFRIGPYRPPLDPLLAKETGHDRGPLVAGEIDVWATRIRYLGLLGGGAGFGWAAYSGHQCINYPDCTVPAGTTVQSMSLKLYPLYAVAVLRIDALARYFHVPLIFSPKLGVEYMRFRINDTNGGSFGAVGFRWGAQIALELDVFDRTAANRLDSEWGINHSYIFFELYGSTSQNHGFDVSQNVAWIAGLGLIL